MGHWSERNRDIKVIRGRTLVEGTDGILPLETTVDQVQTSFIYFHTSGMKG